jgi:hypothetical protein
MALKAIKTELQVQHLKPREDRYELPLDKSHARLVVFPSGNMSWVFRYRFGGRTRKMTLEAGPTDLKRARELAMRAYNAVKAGTDPGVEQQEKKLAGPAIRQNGRHERMHLTLKKETTRPPGANSLQQQERFDAFIHEFNTERPHEALEMKCPAEL